jgi:hypothetical protein
MTDDYPALHTRVYLDRSSRLSRSAQLPPETLTIWRSRRHDPERDKTVEAVS